MLPEYFTIYLIGFSGVGKTTVGAKLAQKMEASFFDIDAEIVKKENKEIVDIFRIKGEQYFRYLEVEMTQKVSNKRNKKKVISLGGGAFENKEIRHCVKEHGIAIYLSACQQKIFKRIKSKTNRPLLKNNDKQEKMSAADLKKQIQTLMSARLENYKKADIRVAIQSKTVSQLVNEIYGKLV